MLVCLLYVILLPNMLVSLIYVFVYSGICATPQQQDTRATSYCHMSGTLQKYYTQDTNYSDIWATHQQNDKLATYYFEQSHHPSIPVRLLCRHHLPSSITASPSPCILSSTSLCIPSISVDLKISLQRLQNISVSPKSLLIEGRNPHPLRGMTGTIVPTANQPPHPPFSTPLLLRHSKELVYPQRVRMKCVQTSLPIRFHVDVIRFRTHKRGE